MAQKRIKIQLTLPTDIVILIEKETSESYTSLSLWFEKILRQHFEEHNKTYRGAKKQIELDI